MATICIKAIVSGRVQGVGYRFSTQYEASRFDLTGYARNLVDGTVEVVACGEQAKVERLLHWLAEGPRMAKVSDVQWQQIEPAAYRGFVTR